MEPTQVQTSLNQQLAHPMLNKPPLPYAQTTSTNNSGPDSERMSKKLTLVLLRREGEILLGLKKRGFGEGKWNGFGGKVEPNETILEGAIRELEEESGAVVDKADMTQVGDVTFEFEGKPVLLHVHVFLTWKFSGTIAETEEMRPQWYRLEDIPYDQMWADDKIWYPIVLQGQKIRARFLFKDMDTILKSDVATVETI